MQKSISKAAIIWRLILSGFIVTSLISCEDTNTVGGGVVEPAEILVDTLYPAVFEQQELDIFSGNLTNLPIGTYDDPLFGNIDISGFVRPVLLPVESKAINDSTQLKLLLKTNLENFYGDTTSSINFSLFKVTELWRGSSILSTDQVAYDDSQPIGSFTYQGQDSIIVDLSESYLLEYANYVNYDGSDRDSLYNFEFFGLAIIPEATSSQILFPNIVSSTFLKIKETDTLSVAIRDRGFTVERTNKPSFIDKIYLNGYLESFYSINFEELLNGVEAQNILKAELYLYEDTAQLLSSLPINNVRPTAEFLELRFNDAQEVRYDLQFIQPDFIGVRDTAASFFKFDITKHINNYVFGDPAEKELNLSLGVNSGILNSSLFYDSSASAELKPKLILTIAAE